MPESEAQARTKIDQALQASGWSVQPYRDFDSSASRSIALNVGTRRLIQRVLDDRNISTTFALIYRLIEFTKGTHSVFCEPRQIFARSTKGNFHLFAAADILQTLT
jgi:hypothetical protein